MKRILITNDDGFESEALLRLVKRLKKDLKAHILVVAPAREKSACSHAITLSQPLRFVKVAKDFYKLDDGTPSDCVYLALAKFYKKTLPDLVISGINKGANVGEDISYSGTCGGAMEAVLQGIPALALSQLYENPKKLNYKNALKITSKIVKKILNQGFPLNKKEFLNVNFPAKKLRGIKICKMGKRVYNFKASSHSNPRGQEFFWLPLTDLEFRGKNSDVAFLKQGFATMTPIRLDFTAYESFKTLKKWLRNT